MSNQYDTDTKEMHAHVLVFPFPAQGHMIPLLDLAAQIASAGLTVTVVVTPKNLPLLSRLPRSISITPLVLPFPHHPNIPPGVENLAHLPAAAFRFMLHSLRDLRDPLLRWFRTHPSPPSAIVSDLFLGWTHHLGIRRYVFCPCGALAFSIINSLWSEMPTARNRHHIMDFSNIPNSPSYPWWQLSPIYRTYVEGDPVSEFIKDSFRANALSHGLIFNTFTELERIYLDYLANELGHDRIWPIGPIVPPLEVDTKISSWLDTCEDGTVVYVCFGSLATLSKKQMEELTLGLEKSGVKFILVVKDAIKGHKEIGFENRGVVIRGWAPQVAILRHKAVCVFLTHCGWNSTLESIVAGVPMLAWPMGADQFVNATLLENELGIAVKVCLGDEAVLHSDQLAQHLVEATSDKWVQRRARAVALSKAAQHANNRGGTSFNNFDDFVCQIKK